MNMSKRKKVYFILGLLGVISLIGISYALWTVTLSQQSENKIATSCLNIEILKESEEIVLENAFPITDEEGMKTTPYTFTIRNTCDTFIDYEVSLGMSNATTLNSKYVAVVLDYNEIKTLDTYESTTIDGYKEGRILQKGSLSGGDEVTYNLRLWLDEDITTNDPVFNTKFQGKIHITATIGSYSPVEQGFTKLADAILVNEYQSTDVESAKARIQSKQTPDFSKTAPITIWNEIHSENLTTKTLTTASETLLESEEATKEVVYPMLFKNYTFDTETGMYGLTDGIVVDPTEINDYDTTDYYVCGTDITRNANKEIILTNTSSCSTMYTIKSVVNKKEGTTTLNGIETPLTIHSLSVYPYTQIERESDKSDKGLYVMTDDYGESYYFRGNVKNNYVYFADVYWRIIRINGDGSIRILYAGRTKDATNDELSIGKSAFNLEKSSPAYVGYMYGNIINDSYEQNMSNEVDSTIKTIVDAWYEENIVSRGLSEYIADPGFCNDRELLIGTGIDSSAFSQFKGYERLSNFTPSLQCQNITRDLFTTSTSNTGNKALRFPIGLITNDELIIAGLKITTLNHLNYLYSGTNYWTMTPNSYDVSIGSAGVRRVYSDGGIYNGAVNSPLNNVRPVINLKPNVEISDGIGTAENPFMIKTV